MMQLNTGVWVSCSGLERMDAHGIVGLVPVQLRVGISISWNENTCSYTAKYGHLNILQWARANECPWDEWTCARAAEGGHLNILQWARVNGCPWDEWTCSHAAGDGHLNILQWARANGSPWDSYTCENAVEGRHFDLTANGYPLDQFPI